MKTRAHPSLQMTLLARTELGELGVSGPIDLWPVAASCHAFWIEVYVLA